MDADVEQNMSDACIAFAKRFAWRGGGRISHLDEKTEVVSTVGYTHLLCDFLLLVSGKC